MSLPQIAAVRLGGSPRLPLLVLGPSAGTSARDLWSSSAVHLAEHFEVLAWDLPGHGSSPAADGSLTPGEIAAGVLEMVDEMLANRGELHPSFFHAGAGLGGTVGLILALEAPQRIESVVVIDPEASPELEARLPAVSAPVLVVATSDHAAASHQVSHAVMRGQLAVLDDVTGSAPLEAAAEVARLIVAHAGGDEAIETVSRARSAEIRAFVSEHDDHTVLARPGLDPRSRSVAALTAAAAQGRHDDLPDLLLAARANGLTDAELRELVLQTALHTDLTSTAAALAVTERALSAD
ncbi:hypothetical protein ASD11_17170 [Aeromicrobium sp. Root495]|uniref:alpha/beta fold hydrolase n=1 Tax=Aeromicrobium sp. Root495 TaxID=1736550 RepID=UPI0006F89CDB|nr:alpha/beta fold hydrolase [Aeromicrobium sp. Root495]KQY55283.1 hypothetical protein ASD11_17170 [Aeromicrobium sp. Root495]